MRLSTQGRTLHRNILSITDKPITNLPRFTDANDLREIFKAHPDFDILAIDRNLDDGSCAGHALVYFDNEDDAYAAYDDADANPHVRIDYARIVEAPETLTLQIRDLDATTMREITNRSKDYQRVTFHHSPSEETYGCVIIECTNQAMTEPSLREEDQEILNFRPIFKVAKSSTAPESSTSSKTDPECWCLERDGLHQPGSYWLVHRRPNDYQNGFRVETLSARVLRLEDGTWTSGS